MRDLFFEILKMKICPHCGAEIPDKATSCKECGSDAQTGWSEGAEHADLEMPDYDEILENEFGSPKKRASSIAMAVVAGFVALVLLATFIL